MNNKNSVKLLILPFYIFTILFIFFPIMYMLILSLTEQGYNGVTINNYRKVVDPFYFKIFLSSIQLALISTVLIAIIGYPFGYFMSRAKPSNKKIIMLLIMIPFFTSSLIRLNSWIIVFRNNGILNSLLMRFHLIEKPLKILYSYPAVIIGMMYILLPTMILSIYSSLEKLDYSLVDAARDLGATKLTAFYSIIFKQSIPGLLTGIILCFVPSMGLFFVADILGGNKIVLIGSIIYEQMTRGANQPFAAALSVILMLLTLIMISIYKKIAKNSITNNMM